MAHQQPRVAPSVPSSSLNDAPTISLICHLVATLTLTIKVTPVTPNLVSKYPPIAPLLHPLSSPAPLSLPWFIFTFSKLFLLVSPIGHITAASSGTKNHRISRRYWENTGKMQVLRKTAQQGTPPPHPASVRRLPRQNAMPLALITAGTSAVSTFLWNGRYVLAAPTPLVALTLVEVSAWDDAGDGPWLSSSNLSFDRV